MAMKIRELRILQVFVELRRANLLQKFNIAPVPSWRRALRIANPNIVNLLLGRVLLLRRVHLVTIDFVVPPGVAEVSRLHVSARMHVADHALTRRDGLSEDVA